MTSIWFSEGRSPCKTGANFSGKFCSKVKKYPFRAEREAKVIKKICLLFEMCLHLFVDDQKRGFRHICNL